jgi:Pyruvate/2-oxoacid:ferredoxin oxidoreductase delta subunit
MERLEFAGSRRLRQILEKMMSPDQAQMAAALPGTPEEVAEKTGFDANRVRDNLDELYYKGVVFPRGDFRNRSYYRFARSIGQLHDAVLATEQLDVEKDRPFFELWYDFVMNEMYPFFAERSREAPRPRDRIVPAYKSIKDLPGVLPYENYPELLKAQEKIAVVPCSCRLCTDSVGERCDVHDEVSTWACLQFGRGADYVVARGSGKEISIEEALELNDRVEESGLLHMWPNVAMMTGPKTSCQCCRDCCMTYVPMDQAGLSIGKVWEKSRYQAYVNQEDCDGCQVCVDRCLFDAIEMVRPEGSKKYKATVIPDKCWGCGVCVVGCEPEALKMKVVRPPEHIPAPPAA